VEVEVVLVEVLLVPEVEEEAQEVCFLVLPRYVLVHILFK
jgi:hypothetical protein